MFKSNSIHPRYSFIPDITMSSIPPSPNNTYSQSIQSISNSTSIVAPFSSMNINLSSSTQSQSPTLSTSLKRHRGLNIHRPIVYGNTATLLKKPDNENTHSWTIYVKGLLDEDISYYISKVEFILHESFQSPLRIIDKWPFELTEKGWGEFEIGIRIYFIDPSEKILQLSHFLRLYPIEDIFMISHPQHKNTITIEYYDEIVFQDPTAIMVSILNNQDNESKSLFSHFPSNSPYDVAEKQEQSRLEKVHQYLVTELQKNQLRQAQLTKDLKDLKIT